VTQDDEEQRRRAERARQAGLFRYGLVQDVIDPVRAENLVHVIRPGGTR
jgi:hypothetical protein